MQLITGVAFVPLDIMYNAGITILIVIKSRASVSKNLHSRTNE